MKMSWGSKQEVHMFCLFLLTSGGFVQYSACKVKAMCAWNKNCSQNFLTKALLWTGYTRHGHWKRHCNQKPAAGKNANRKPVVSGNHSADRKPVHDQNLVAKKSTGNQLRKTIVLVIVSYSSYFLFFRMFSALMPFFWCWKRFARFFLMPTSLDTSFFLMLETSFSKRFSWERQHQGTTEIVATGN